MGVLPCQKGVSRNVIHLAAWFPGISSGYEDVAMATMTCCSALTRDRKGMPHDPPLLIRTAPFPCLTWFDPRWSSLFHFGICSGTYLRVVDTNSSTVKTRQFWVPLYFVPLCYYMICYKCVQITIHKTKNSFLLSCCPFLCRNSRLMVNEVIDHQAKYTAMIEPFAGAAAWLWCFHPPYLQEPLWECPRHLLGHRGAWLEWRFLEEITRREITIKWIWKLWALI